MFFIVGLETFRRRLNVLHAKAFLTKNLVIECQLFFICITKHKKAGP
jgi:hypothetical protein